MKGDLSYLNQDSQDVQTSKPSVNFKPADPVSECHTVMPPLQTQIIMSYSRLMMGMMDDHVMGRRWRVAGICTHHTLLLAVESWCTLPVSPRTLCTGAVQTVQ